jgi:membrane-associated phospholipid phosphatase
MQFNFLVRRTLLVMLSLALACPAKAAILPWQVEQSSIQATDTTSTAAKDDAATEQGTSSSSNPSSASSTQAQSPGESKKKTDTQKQEDRAKGTSFKRMFLNVPGDQKVIWTSPFHIHATDSAWLLPLGGVTAGLIGSDEHSMARARSNSTAITLGKNVSDGTLVGLASVPALMYVWGGLHGDSRAHETGLLSGEALINSYVVDEAFKFAFARERPTTTDGQGRFFQTVSNASFPSTHATLGWTLASVIAHEYPGWLSQTLAYSGATAISVSRVAGRQHFPSDVVAGAAVGWLIGRQVFRAHHDPDIDDAEFGTFTSDRQEGEPSHLGSVFVPLDSWIYPELKRLAAMGYIRTQFLGLEPWTREECLRQIQEAEYYAQDSSTPAWIANTIELLKSEFSPDGHFYSAGIDSVYGRYQNISGVPLRDSYHFGQTIRNDFGRPYDRGNSMITGASGSAVAGRFFFYARGEYQHAPGRGPLTAAQSALIASLDQNPVLPASPVSTIDRFYPLDIYAGVQLGKFAVSFGKESMWLGPGESGALMLSDNADPMYGVHLTQTMPIDLPWIFHYLGQIKTEFQFAKLSGHQFPARPFFNLQKISFHPTENLEVGFTRASIWAGVGHPFTARALARNFSSFGDTGLKATDPNDPGDRKSGLDFSYKIPRLRNWLSLYSDFYSDDDPSPLASPRRSAINPGLYLSHFPGISRLDLRVESASTQLLGAVDHGGTFLYYSVEYHDSNTNKGLLFGNATGRDGRSYQGWSTYHLSDETSIQLSYRDVKASSSFLPGGGTQSDASTHLLWRVHPNLQVDAFVQYERWLIPALKATAENNVTGQLQLTFYPKWRIHGD